MSKICIFAAHYLPYLGGIERYTYNLSKALLDLGDEVTIVTCNDMGEKEYEIMEGIRVYRLPCYNFMNGRYPITKWDKSFRRLYKQLLSEDFDLVLINARFYPHTLLGAWFAKKNKTRSIILDHGTSHMTIGKKLPDMIFALVEHGITLGDKLLCKEYFGVSKACCKWLEHFKIQPEGVLYNAVNIQEIKKYLNNPVLDFREKFHISKETAIIVYTGRLIKEKGIFKLIEAVEKLDRKYQVCLFIAGDGEEFENVKKHEGERVKALGRIEFGEIISLLGQAEIYCLPTEYPEGFPTSVLEAAASGCYVITSNRGGSGELILDESYGSILENVTVDNIKREIEKVLDSPQKRSMAARKAKERVNQIYIWEKTAKKVHYLAERGVKR